MTNNLESLNIMERRIKRKPTLGEVFGVMFGVLLSIGLVVIRQQQGFDTIQGIDFGTFMNSVEGNYADFYYPNWSIALFWLIRLLYFPALMYVVWNTLNLLGIAFAARVFDGKSLVALLSYQMLFSLYFGQIVGVLVAGLAWYWWFMRRDQPLIAGIGAVLALIKPQVSVPILITMGLLANEKWRSRIISSVPSVVALVLSLLVWGNWIADLLARSEANPPMTAGSIALWQYIGAWCFLLWIPAIVVPMSPIRRLVIITATTAIATPYYIHNGLLSLFVLPVGWLGLLGNLGYLMATMGWAAVKLTAIVPIVAYGWVLWISLREQFANKKPQSI